MASTVTAESIDRDEINDNLDMACAAADKFQFNTAKGYLQVLLTLLPALKTPLRIYKNTLTSVTEGLRDSVITDSVARTNVKAANAILRREVNALIGSTTKREETGPEDWFKGLSTDSLKVYDTNMNQVQVQLNKHGVFQGYVPVLPLTSPPLDTAKLKKQGIQADNFAGYTILKKEFVAGITLEALAKLIPKQKGSLKDAAPLELLDNKELREAAMEEFRDLILSKHKGLKLTQMGEPSAWWNAMWIWFAPNSEFRLLKQCTINSTEVSSLKIRNWSFPFNR